jgi:hypothetical protein
VREGALILCGYDAGRDCDQREYSAAMPLVPSRTKEWVNNRLRFIMPTN